MTERIRFTVTQEHIDKGCSNHDADTNCPIARALRDARPNTEWHVWGSIRGHRTGLVTEGRYESRPKWQLSHRASRFIRAFDAKQPVAPFTGEIYR